jgi:hypothetical protein
MTEQVQQTAPIGVNTGTEIRIQPANRAVLKTVKDLQVKKARAEYHGSLVASAINEGRTINGLRRDVKPQIPDIPVGLAIKWEEAHNTFTDTLTKLLQEYWTSKRETIEAEIVSALHFLTINATPEEEITRISSVAAEACTIETARLLAPKPQRVRTIRQPRKRLNVGATSTSAANTRN